MTKKTALSILSQSVKACDLSAFNDEQKNKIDEALDVVAGMIDQLSQSRTTSPEAKAKATAKRATERAEATKDVIPAVVAILEERPDLTAKEVAEALGKAEWTVAKVQYLLLNDLASKVGKVEVKGKPNTYHLLPQE
jgi:hypothetical protein